MGSLSFDLILYSFVRSQWYPEIQHHAPNIPMILVGTKLDLRIDPETKEKLRERRMEPIEYELAFELSKEIGARRQAMGDISAFTFG